MLVIIAIGILVWVGLKYATPQASPISPDDPLWIAAVRRARTTLPEMREFQRAGRDVWVKFPFQTQSGTTEHVWGRVTAVNGEALQCTLETPPMAGSSTTTPGRTEIASAEIEDWQVELDDGTIRGGFTTRAQAEIAKRHGQSVPRHIEDMIRRMAD